MARYNDHNTTGTKVISINGTAHSPTDDWVRTPSRIKPILANVIIVGTTIKTQAVLIVWFAWLLYKASKERQRCQ